MTGGSLRVRLIIAVSIALSVALLLAGFAFSYIFQTHVERLMLQEFNAHFQQLATIVSIDERGNLQVDGELSDPRFSKQFGGLYWQVDAPNKSSLRSRSLWDEELAVPTPPSEQEEEHVHTLVGPNEVSILALERMLSFERTDGSKLETVVTIGMDRTSVSNAIADFSNTMKLGLAGLYVFLLGVAVAQIYYGLRPLQAIRKSLAGVASGKMSRMLGQYPDEVQPLVSEINSLLDSRDLQLERTRHRAGNLAHGLKTPLTILDTLSAELARSGKVAEANDIKIATRDMRQLVDRELARARASATRSVTPVAIGPVVQRVINALKKTPKGKVTQWICDDPNNAKIAIENEDLTEIVGNLLDNAQKFSDQKVQVTLSTDMIVIDDDGVGVPESALQDITRRGVRLDEKMPGSGLGLSIVQDLIDAYEATLEFTKSPLGGLRATIRAKARSL